MIGWLGVLPAIAVVVVAVDNPSGALACLAYFGLLFFVVVVLFHRKL